jgi:hypothetical protein
VVTVCNDQQTDKNQARRRLWEGQLQMEQLRKVDEAGCILPAYCQVLWKVQPESSLWTRSLYPR